MYRTLDMTRKIQKPEKKTTEIKVAIKVPSKSLKRNCAFEDLSL